MEDDKLPAWRKWDLLVGDGMTPFYWLLMGLFYTVTSPFALIGLIVRRLRR